MLIVARYNSTVAAQLFVENGAKTYVYTRNNQGTGWKSWIKLTDYDWVSPTNVKHQLTLATPIVAMSNSMICFDIYVPRGMKTISVSNLPSSINATDLSNMTNVTIQITGVNSYVFEQGSDIVNVRLNASGCIGSHMYIAQATKYFTVTYTY